MNQALSLRNGCFNQFEVSNILWYICWDPLFFDIIVIGAIIVSFIVSARVWGSLAMINRKMKLIIYSGPHLLYHDSDDNVWQANFYVLCFTTCTCYISIISYIIPLLCANNKIIKLCTLLPTFKISVPCFSQLIINVYAITWNLYIIGNYFHVLEGSLGVYPHLHACHAHGMVKLPHIHTVHTSSIERVGQDCLSLVRIQSLN